MNAESHPKEEKDSKQPGAGQMEYRLMESTEETMKKLLSIGNCVLCDLPFSEPEHSCTNGHTICCFCFVLLQKKSVCPYCNEQLFVRRNLALKQVLHLWEVKCEYCHQWKSPMLIREHWLSSCLKVPPQFHCILPSCQESFNNLDDFVAHAFAAHKYEVCPNETQIRDYFLKFRPFLLPVSANTPFVRVAGAVPRPVVADAGAKPERRPPYLCVLHCDYVRYAQIYDTAHLVITKICVSKVKLVAKITGEHSTIVLNRLVGERPAIQRTIDEDGGVLSKQKSPSVLHPMIPVKALTSSAAASSANLEIISLDILNEPETSAKEETKEVYACSKAGERV